MSSEDRTMDQGAISEQGSEESKHYRLTRWDVKPSIPIPLVQPRCNMMKELKIGGLTAGLTSRQPQVDEMQERLQRAERDRRSQGERNRQIQAGSAGEPIFHPHLQEPTAVAPLQPPCLVNEVCMELMDALIRRTA